MPRETSRRLLLWHISQAACWVGSNVVGHPGCDPTRIRQLDLVQCLVFGRHGPIGLYMRRRIPPLVGEQLITPYGSSIQPCDPVTPGDRAVVVFWSAGCEASLERLKQLSTDPRFGQAGSPELWTVHAPRFPCDEQVDDVGLTMARQNIGFPAIHDPRFKTWRRYNPEGWPATVIIDRGSVVGIDHGLASVTTVLDQLWGAPAANDGAETTGAQQRQLRQQAETDPGSLRFPQGIAVHGNRLVIADTGNDRLLAGSLAPDTWTFTVDRVFDGLDRPTSMAALDSGHLAIIENNEQITSVDTQAGRTSLLTAEATRPSGLCVDDHGSLVVSDSASNKLLRLSADVGGANNAPTLTAIAGSGRLGCRAGNARQAEFAQPVAVASSRAGLVVVDAASSAIRLVTNGGRVLNVTTGDLYRFGLVDGRAHRAVFQRPTALCCLDNGDVVIADGGNNRLRLLTRQRVETLPVDGLRRPGAIAAVDSEWLVVADTDNHRMVLVNLRRNLVHQLRISGLTGADRSTASDNTTHGDGPGYSPNAVVGQHRVTTDDLQQQSVLQ